MCRTGEQQWWYLVRGGGGLEWRDGVWLGPLAVGAMRDPGIRGRGSSLKSPSKFPCKPALEYER